jgi:hypothetical protein
LWGKCLSLTDKFILVAIALRKNGFKIVLWQISDLM